MAVVDERQLVGAAFLDMAIHAVVAGIDLAARESAVKELVGIVDGLVPTLASVDIFSHFGPEPGWVGRCRLVGLSVFACVFARCVSLCVRYLFLVGSHRSHRVYCSSQSSTVVHRKWHATKCSVLLAEGLLDSKGVFVLQMSCARGQRV